jgi:hypothetical protein
MHDPRLDVVVELGDADGSGDQWEEKTVVY